MRFATKAFSTQSIQRSRPLLSQRVCLSCVWASLSILNFYSLPPTVRSFGTEDRVTEKPVAPRSEVYEYIIFRASDIKDLLVEDPPSSPGLSDPAIIQAQGGSSSGPASSAASFPSPTGYGASGSGSPSTVAGLIGSAAPGSSTGSRSNVQPVSVQQSNRDHDRGNKSGQQGLSSVMVSGKAVGGHRSGTRPVSPGVVGSNRGKSPSDQRRRDGSGNRDQQRPRTFNDQRRGNQDHDNRPQNRASNRDQYQNRDARPFRDDQRQFRDGDRRQTGFQDRRPRDSNQDNRGGFRSNQRSDWPGQRPHRQSDDNRRDYQRENRPPRTRPPMLDVRKLEEYDFEKANAEFVELTKDIEDLKISEDKKDGDAQDSKSETKGESGDVIIETYNKTKSFFDTLSCEALERQKG